jgi:hypothetical protein
MHFVDLANELALSLVERSANKKVINYWAPFQDLYKVLRAAFKYLFDKKNKRFGLYQKALARIHQRVIRPSLPCTTRVAGALIVHQQSLRSMHAWRFYSSCCDGFEALLPTRAQWRCIAQFEAVMRSGMALCFHSQKDRVETAGEMVLALVELSANYQSHDVYEVVHVDGDAWLATTSFDDIPRVKMTISKETATAKNIP